MFLLGPCHRAYLQKCGLTSKKQYQTPLGNLTIDQDIIHSLSQSGQFLTVDPKDEENEHSLELHLPFIYKLFEKSINLVPIMVPAVQ